MKKLTLLLIAFIVYTIQAQVGIGTTTPDITSVLDLTSTSKGFLAPRMTATAKNAITSPALGLLIFQTDGIVGFYYYTGSAWEMFSSTSTIGLDDLNDAKSGGSGFTGSLLLGHETTGTLAAAINNTGVGIGALQAITTGANNTALGNQTLYSNTTGANNSAIGYQALYSNTSGYHNTVNGYQAAYTSTSGYGNTAMGHGAGYGISTGYYNTIVGYDAGKVINTGHYKTVVGYGAGIAMTTGYHNTLFGYGAGDGITTGFHNTAIGYNAQVPTATGSNQVRIGDASVSYAGIQVAWTVTSDKRWKHDIQPSNLGLEFINNLKPVSYIRNNSDSHKREYGFIAQDLEQTLNSMGSADNGIINKDDNGMLSVRYNDLLSPLVKAIQEQQMQIDALFTQNEGQRKEIAQLKEQISLSYSTSR
jgi:hypothetical protein